MPVHDDQSELEKKKLSIIVLGIVVLIKIQIKIPDTLTTKLYKLPLVCQPTFKIFQFIVGLARK